ncbi:MAG TPA: hypothetical protein VG122_26175 [Gemmata sp.]|jgi:hypothetical protein|nr:hypothetical protein [Gemmata sp.]
MRTYLRVCAVVIGLMGLGMLLPPGLGQTPKSDPPKESPKTATKLSLTIKVFKLERSEPTTVIEAMNNLLEETDVAIAAPMPPAGGPGLKPPPGGIAGFGGNPIGFGGMGGVGLGFGGGVGGGMQSTPAWRATLDERTKSLIVRGSTRHIQVAADLVALVDRPAKAALPELKIVKAFPLKDASTMELMTVIEALDFEDLRVSSLNEKLLVAIGPEEVTKAIRELVKELDVPGKKELDVPDKPGSGPK